MVGLKAPCCGKGRGKRLWTRARRQALRHAAFVAVYLETYGCQMNVSDTEIAWAILQQSGYARTERLEEVRRLGARASRRAGPASPGSRLACSPAGRWDVCSPSFVE